MTKSVPKDFVSKDVTKGFHFYLFDKNSYQYLEKLPTEGKAQKFFRQEAPIKVLIEPGKSIYGTINYDPQLKNFTLHGEFQGLQEKISKVNPFELHFCLDTETVISRARVISCTDSQIQIEPTGLRFGKRISLNQIATVYTLPTDVCTEIKDQGLKVIRWESKLKASQTPEKNLCQEYFQTDKIEDPILKVLGHGKRLHCRLQDLSPGGIGLMINKTFIESVTESYSFYITMELMIKNYRRSFSLFGIVRNVQHVSDNLCILHCSFLERLSKKLFA